MSTSAASHSVSSAEMPLSPEQFQVWLLGYLAAVGSVGLTSEQVDKVRGALARVTVQAPALQWIPAPAPVPYTPPAQPYQTLPKPTSPWGGFEIWCSADGAAVRGQA